MIKFSTTKSKYFINTSGDNIIVYKKLFLFVFYKHKLFKALDKRYDADIAAAYASALIYFDNPVGIGEHPQHLEEIDKQLGKIGHAKEKLEVLKDFE